MSNIKRPRRKQYKLCGNCPKFSDCKVGRERMIEVHHGMAIYSDIGCYDFGDYQNDRQLTLRIKGV